MTLAEITFRQLAALSILVVWRCAPDHAVRAADGLIRALVSGQEGEDDEP